MKLQKVRLNRFNVAFYKRSRRSHNNKWLVIFGRVCENGCQTVMLAGLYKVAGE